MTTAFCAAPALDDANVTIRLDAALVSLIDQAAQAHRQSAPDFIREALRHAAIDAMCDQTDVVLSEDAFAECHKILDATEPNEAFLRLMAAPSPWTE